MSEKTRLIGESWAPEALVQGSANRRAAFDNSFLLAAGIKLEDTEHEDLGMKISTGLEAAPHWVTRFYHKEHKEKRP